MAWLRKRLTFIVLALILLSPSIYFGGFYAVSLASPGKASQYTSSSSDGNWSLTVGLSYPSYMLSGLRAPVTIMVNLKLTQPYVALYLSQVGIEIRQASVINSTTNVVQSWTTLFSNYTNMGKNFTATGTIIRIFDPPITYPLNGSVTDVLAGGRKLAINGIVNFTTYAAPGSSAATSTQVLSVLDAQTTYLTQLSDVASSLSWIFYQVVSLAIVSVVYISVRMKIRSPPVPADSRYTARLGSLRLERSLAKLEEWMKSNMISEAKYRDLKERLERELEQLNKRGTVSTEEE